MNNSNNPNSNTNDNLDKSNKDSSNNEFNKESDINNYSNNNNNNSIALNESDSSSNIDNITCEELHKDNEKVNIGDTKFSKPKKKHTLLKIFLGLIIIIALLVFIGLKLVDNTSSLKDHYDNIDYYKNQLISELNLNTPSKQDLQDAAIKDVFDNLKVNNDGTATINVSKSVIYSYVDLDTLNNIKYFKDNNIVVNEFGYDLDTSDKTNEYINIYGNITYKGIKAGLTGKLNFSFEDDDLIIKFINAKIGNLPTSLYKNYLPKEGEILYKQDISYSLKVADVSVKLFSPMDIKEIDYDNKTGIISIIFNYSDALNKINDELFNEDNGDSKFSEILKYYLGEGTDKLNKYIDEANDYLKDNLGFDISDINDFLKLFNN